MGEELVDGLVFDILMPDVDGYAVLDFLQATPRLKDIPVIVVSAKSMPSDIRTGMDAGASMYLTKPVGYLDLKHAVERLTKDGADPSSPA